MRYSDVRWRKSSRSGEQGNCVEVGAWCKSTRSTDQGHCVEVGVHPVDTGSGGGSVRVSPWKASSHSTQQGNCVEVASERAVVLARDSKDPDGPVLGFGADAWAAFLNTVKSGRLDLA
ncbi:DUF397 domain-containing protein [Actinomadura sp. NAK00032]|uniref:DUF397 domain-containing protein n=1 Tax=Actinomadura sp. NAK00032 TaxID=2742128 RepID=UPI001592A2EB|nr:DUF397 domain-containing protein [Actinomadura sp. NAK00032]QKW38612.1 DUF397 domain-containing protein [Actinomadura sp. NAK00032]